MSDQIEYKALCQLQEQVLGQLLAMNDPQLSHAKLCGGTALARFWLHHRISYDLDFFLPEGFKAGNLAGALKKAGVSYDTKDLVDDLHKANQLHGFVNLQGRLLKVSFVEDAYLQLYPPVVKPLGTMLVTTEELPGLYHRKLRTVAGSGSDGETVVGGRQKARDLFDLYVLSQAYQPIRAFIAALPYAFPADAFDNGLASMPWFDLADELKEIACADKWRAATDIRHLQNALMNEIGAYVLDDFLQDLDGPDNAEGLPK